MVTLKSAVALFALALAIFATDITARGEEKSSSPKLRVSCHWRVDGRGIYSISFKLKNFEDYEVGVNQVSLDKSEWTVIGHSAPAAGTLDFTITAKREPVVLYIETVKYGTIKFDLDQPQ